MEINDKPLRGGRAMEPEEMDVVELVEEVAVQPQWRVGKADAPAPDRLSAGQRGMVVHRSEQEPTTYDVEFVDGATKEPMVLARLRGDQLRVVERDDLIVE
jgi:hypothetical protein